MFGGERRGVSDEEGKDLVLVLVSVRIAVSGFLGRASDCLEKGKLETKGLEEGTGRD